MYYQFSNLWLSLWNGNIYSNGSAVSPKELLDELRNGTGSRLTDDDLRHLEEKFTRAHRSH